MKSSITGENSSLSSKLKSSNINSTSKSKKLNLYLKKSQSYNKFGEKKIINCHGISSKIKKDMISPKTIEYSKS